MKTTPSQQYANVLEEIDIRLAAIDHCTLNRSGLAPPFVKDFCYLQIRMICELVALGCLIAHGDQKEVTSKKLQGAWSADKIMSTLEGLHPYFYPQPVKLTITAEVHLQIIKPSPLPKDAFLRLYRKCGGMLHRGSLRGLLKGQFPHVVHYPEITQEAQKLVELLQVHELVMKDGEQMFIGMLRAAPDMKAKVATVQTPKGQPMDFASPDFLRDPPR